MWQKISDLIFTVMNWQNVRAQRQASREQTGDIEPEEVISSQPVDIVVDMSVRTKYQAGWINKVRNVSPTDFVVHGTAGGTTVNGLIKWMVGGELAANYLKGIGLFHYAIGRGAKGEADGLITEIISPSYWVHHATAGSKARYQIGTELLNPSRSNRDPYTDAQYESLFKLYFDHLLPIYPSMKRVVGHRWSLWNYNSASTAARYDKACPGQGFDWTKFTDEADRRGFGVKSIGTPGKEGFELITE